ncbi:MAG TPA: YlxR family protein [Candidatus Limnocylindria bacterium]|nr:YlxR family protein [Candidatus Limnocylindria bacterium]
MPKRRPDHVPMRTCAACRQVRPKRSLTRLVRRADGSVAIDPTGKLAGRGTYICDQPDCRAPERMRAAVSRALGVETTIEALADEETHAAT